MTPLRMRRAAALCLLPLALVAAPAAGAQEAPAQAPKLLLRLAPAGSAAETVAPAPPAPAAGSEGAALRPLRRAAAAPGDPFAARIAVATEREDLVGLLAAGADAVQVAARLAALGYVPAEVAGASEWLRPGDGEVVRDCGDCPELVVVPAGAVTMRVEIGGVASEVAIALPAPLGVGRFEVTRREFAAFVAATGHATAPGCYARAPEWTLDPELDWRDPGYAQGDDHPVACVSALDAEAYAAWLSARTGEAYRLPTDAEWHFVAAAATSAARDLCASGNGADASALAVHPGWSGAPCDDGHAHTAPAGRFAASPWGLHDLDGNLWEWVSTCAPAAAGEPFPPLSCAPGAARILRGGSFADRPALREADARLVSAPTVRDQVAGFRVVRDLR